LNKFDRGCLLPGEDCRVEVEAREAVFLLLAVVAEEVERNYHCMQWQLVVAGCDDLAVVFAGVDKIDYFIALRMRMLLLLSVIII